MGKPQSNEEQHLLEETHELLSTSVALRARLLDIFLKENIAEIEKAAPLANPLDDATDKVIQARCIIVECRTIIEQNIIIKL